MEPLNPMSKNAEGSLIDFKATGPNKIRSSNPEWKRTLLACLVNAAYIYEMERQEGMRPPKSESRGAAWHEAFHYKLHSFLYSPADGSIFGAVFVYSRIYAVQAWQLWRPAASPSVVVALRGTILSAASIISDIRDDVNLILQQMHKVSRLDETLRVTRHMVARYGHVCLTGHSLGAAVALKVSRIMAQEGAGILLDTHLFNPPFFSLISVKDEKLGVYIHKIRAMAAGCLVKGSKDGDQAQAAFLALQKWCPHLYINVYDPVSCNYLHYFRARQSSTAHNSIVNSILRSMGRNSEPHHLVPSATMHINAGGGKEFRVAHGLYQWWSEDTVLHTQHHSLDVPDFVDRVNKFTQVTDSGEEKVVTSPLIAPQETNTSPSKAATFVPTKAVLKLIGGW